MSHDKFFGICENKCLVEINADSVGAAAQDLSNIDNAVFAEKATAAGVGGGGIGSEVVPIENGGTGATTAEDARNNLGVASSDLSNVDNTVFLEKVSNVGVSGGTVLFSNESGTTDTTITLSDDVSNYRYVEIYYERVKHTHTPDPVRPEYYADNNNNLTIPSEGLPITTHYFENIEELSNGFTEDTFACCVGMEKVNIIPTSGVSHFLISTAFIETTNLTANGAVYNSKDLKSTMKQSEYQLNAHLIGNVLSYDFHYMITTYNASWVTSYEYYSQGPYWQRTISPNYNHHTSFSESRSDVLWKMSGAKYPKVYTIIGYK